jgi:hypothetical protein
LEWFILCLSIIRRLRRHHLHLTTQEDHCQVASLWIHIWACLVSTFYYFWSSRWTYWSQLSYA